MIIPDICAVQAASFLRVLSELFNLESLRMPGLYSACLRCALNLYFVYAETGLICLLQFDELPAGSEPGVSGVVDELVRVGGGNTSLVDQEVRDGS